MPPQWQLDAQLITPSMSTGCFIHTASNTEAIREHSHPLCSPTHILLKCLTDQDAIQIYLKKKWRYLPILLRDIQVHHSLAWEGSTESMTHMLAKQWGKHKQNHQHRPRKPRLHQAPNFHRQNLWPMWAQLSHKTDDQYSYWIVLNWTVGSAGCLHWAQWLYVCMCITQLSVAVSFALICGVTTLELIYLATFNSLLWAYTVLH